jgi:hypothetical protein
MRGPSRLVASSSPDPHTPSSVAATGSGAHDIDAAIEWLDTPKEWRRGGPTGRGVRRVLAIVDRLRVAAGE